MQSKFTKTRIRKFFSYYKPHRGIFLLDMLFAALSAGSTLLFPLVSGYLTGEVFTQWDSSSQSKVFAAAGILVLLTGIKVVSNILYAYFGHAMGAKMEGAMRRELFTQYEALSFDFHARHSTGQLLTVLTNDTMSMTEMFHHAPENLLITVIKTVGSFVFMFSLHVPLTLLVFLFLPFLAVLAYWADRRMEACLLQNRQDLSDMNEEAEDTLSGIRTVKAFGKEKDHAMRFGMKNDRYTASRCLFYKLEALFYESVSAFPQFLTMLVVIFGSLFLSKGDMSPAVLVTFLLYAGTLSEPINTLITFMHLFEEGKAGFIRFMEMIERTPAVTEAPHPIRPTSVTGTICFDDVSFSYPGAPDNVLEHVSLTIESGQCVAFAGASGIGKTTVASLIARFYDVTGGAVTLDGNDVRTLPLSFLRDHIGLVQQEVYLFAGTIRDNIRYGREDASEDEIIRAAKLANLHDFILSLPDGYDSVVGTKGILLSGGQRQRISLARLFLKDPRILILDEATSALDYESEAVVQQAIERLRKNRTTILIAHRLSTIRTADRIFVLGDKGLSEQGTHASLLAQNGLYAALYRQGES